MLLRMTAGGPAAGSSPGSSNTAVILVVGPPGGGQDTVGDWLRASGIPVPSDSPLAELRDRLWRDTRATPTAPPELDRPGPVSPSASGVGAIDAGSVMAADGPVGESSVPEGLIGVVDRDLALLLPVFARPVPNVAVVLAWRSVEATVHALASKGVGTVHAASLWEAHLVSALRGAAGLPLVALDLDEPAEARARLEAFLQRLGVERADAVSETDVSAPATAPSVGAADHAAAAHDAALTRALVAEATEGLSSALAAAAGPHDAWDPPEGLALGPFAEAVLDAHRAAHRAVLDAAAAWAHAHDAEVAAQDAKAAVEREHRELVGPDPVHYAELRRELWRLRDDLAGAVAGRVHFRTEWMRADAARLAAEARVNDVLTRLEQQQAHIDHLEAARDEILQSERWKIGGAVLSPFARVRRWFTRR